MLRCAASQASDPAKSRWFHGFSYMQHPVTPSAPEAACSRRAEVRRAQILDAARICFCEHGFHGASIARICQTASMSPGHIYHYFRNKEEIIAAIVEQDLARVLDFHKRLRDASDFASTVSECVAEGVRGALDPAQTALKLEILAEATRNARVAELVRTADARLRASFIETMRFIGREDSDEALHCCLDSLSELFDGLVVRGVRNPGLDVEQATRRHQQAVLKLLGL